MDKKTILILWHMVYGLKTILVLWRMVYGPKNTPGPMDYGLWTKKHP